MAICLDTNIFSSDVKFFDWIESNIIYAFVPSTAYMELAYHYKKKHGSKKLLDYLLDSYGMEVVPFDMGLADIASSQALLKHDLSVNARDYAIGAYAYAHDLPMITYNKKHFTWLKEVYTPEELMKKVG
jgi:tRNA(fMet)-specific endonuclease VapC